MKYRRYSSNLFDAIGIRPTLAIYLFYLLGVEKRYSIPQRASVHRLESKDFLSVSKDSPDGFDGH